MASLPQLSRRFGNGQGGPGGSHEIALHGEDERGYLVFEIIVGQTTAPDSSPGYLEIVYGGEQPIPVGERVLVSYHDLPSDYYPALSDRHLNLPRDRGLHNVSGINVGAAMRHDIVSICPMTKLYTLVYLRENRFLPLRQELEQINWRSLGLTIPAGRFNASIVRRLQELLVQFMEQETQLALWEADVEPLEDEHPIFRLMTCGRTFERLPERKIQLVLTALERRISALRAATFDYPGGWR